MLRYQSSTYDPARRSLVVRLVSPSRTRWALYEYRDVAPETYQHLREDRATPTTTLRAEVAPAHDVRRVGTSSWHRAPQPLPGDELER